jgi:hypothetical protein
LLAEKAEKFEKDCNGAYSMFSPYCQRRAKHMYRSMMFLTKSQDSKFVEGLSEEERAADRAAFEESLTHMEKFAGDNMEYVVMLKEKMIARGSADTNTIKVVVTLLTKLLQGSESEQEEARNLIKFMDSEENPAQELTEDEKAEQEEMLKNLAEHEDEIQNALEDRAAELDPEDGEEDLGEVDEEADGALLEEASKGENATALVQSDGELVDVNVKVVVKGIVFIIITFLIVAAIIWTVLASLSVLVGFALVILIGCACYDLGKNNGMLSGDETFNCIAEIFKWPIVTGGQALEWYFDEFTPREFK